jgi:hypothetical protein
MRDGELLQGPLFPGGAVQDEPDHPDLVVESDGLFELFLLNGGGPKRKRAPRMVRPQCSEEGCMSQGESYGRCKRHSGKTAKRCSYQGCETGARGPSGLCIHHSIYETAVVKAAAMGLPAPDTREAKDLTSYTAREDCTE